VAIQEEQRRAELRLTQDYLSSLGDQADPQARTAATQQFRSVGDPLQAEAEAAQLEALGPRQRPRLDQIQLQADGPLAFSRPEVLEWLNLNPGQVKAIQEIVARGRVRMLATSAVPLGVKPGHGPPTPEQYRTLSRSQEFEENRAKSREATLKARDATLQEIAKVLTKGQGATYQKMLGAPFDLAKLRGDGTAPATETM